MRRRIQALIIGLVAGCATGAGDADTGSSNDDDDGGEGASSGAAGAGGGDGGSGEGCPAGFELNGGMCIDIDECALETDDCDPAATCVNDEPGFHCGPCPAGTTDVNGDGTECADVDECALETDDCDPLAGCINDVPGFHCGECPSGTIDTNGDGTLCTAANVVGLDNRHGYDAATILATGAHHTQLRAAITGAGFTHATLDNLDTPNLVGLGALFVYQAYDTNPSPFSTTEIAAMVAFVNAGGGLVVFGDGGSGGNQANLNLLAQSWGVTFSTTNMWPSGLVISTLVAHPVTAGVASFGLDYGVPMTVNTPAVALNTGANVVLAAVTGAGGSGNVVFVSDGCFNNSPSTDYNISSLNNALLLDNIIAFVTP